MIDCVTPITGIPAEFMEAIDAAVQIAVERHGAIEHEGPAGRGGGLGGSPDQALYKAIRERGENPIAEQMAQAAEAELRSRKMWRDLNARVRVKTAVSKA